MRSLVEVVSPNLAKRSVVLLGAGQASVEQSHPLELDRCQGRR